MITYQFVASAQLSSRVIAWWGGGFAGHGYSHVDCVMADGSLIGARWDDVGGGAGVLARKPFYERWVRRTQVTLVCDPAQQQDWETFVRRQLDAPYDTSAIIGFLEERERHTPGRWICSALGYASAAQVGLVQQPTLLVSSEVTPDDWFLVASSLRGSLVQQLPPQP